MAQSSTSQINRIPRPRLARGERPLQLMARGGLVVRIASGAVLIVALAGALWFGGVVFDVVIGLAVAVGVWEFSELMCRVGLPPPPWVIYPLSGWLVYRFLLPANIPAVEIALAAAVVIGLVGGLVATQASVSRWAVAVGGALYLGFCTGYYIALLRWRPGDQSHLGLRLIVLPLAAAIVGDTAAYLVGSAIGRHRFFPSLSPSKSIEGALAGALAAVVVVGVLGSWLSGLRWYQSAVLGMALTVASQGGDLVESALKRSAGVKDSSRLIPGHGGLLDRLDSLLLPGPVVYWFLKLIDFR